MKSTQSRIARSALGLALLVVLTVAMQMAVSGKGVKNDRVVVWLFDVGQGDAIFIDAPGAQVLIDGGPSGVVVEKLTAVMPFWDRRIDLLVNTHPHADHVTGLVHVLGRYRVDDVWTSGQDYGTDVFDAFAFAANERAVQAGDVFYLGAGATLTVLWPNTVARGRLENPHDTNVTILLEYGETTMLFTGDMETDIEEHIIDSLGHIDVLKVGHHGSLTSTSRELLDDTTPDYAVVQVGVQNSYGHPHPVVIDRLLDHDVTILRTDTDGDVRIVTDGGEPRLTLFDL